MLTHTVLVLAEPRLLGKWLATVLPGATLAERCEGDYLELRSDATTAVLALVTPAVMATFTGHAPVVYAGGGLVSWRCSSWVVLEQVWQHALSEGAKVLQAPTMMPWGHVTAMLCPPLAVLGVELLIELAVPLASDV
jgi:hypothetical protein